MVKTLTIPADMKKLMSQQASTEAAREVDDSPQVISAKGKKFRMGDTQLPDVLEVTVGLAAFESAWYDRPYDPENTSVPACFAIGTHSEPTEPHPDSPLPQAKYCSECPHNVWGSGTNGKGKACKNARRLVLIADDGVTSFNEAQLAVLKIPPTSLKGWSGYAKTVNLRHDLPTWAVVTDISFDQGFDYPRLQFALHDIVTDPAKLAAIHSREEEIETFGIRPFNVSDFEPYNTKASAKKKGKMS